MAEHTPPADDPNGSVEPVYTTPTSRRSLERATAPDATPPARGLVGPTIRAWRLYRGLTLAELARRARLNPGGTSSLSRLESGRTRTVNDDRLRAIAAELGVSVPKLNAGALPPDSKATPRHYGSSAAQRRRSQFADLQASMAELRADVHLLDQTVKQLLELFTTNAVQRSPQSADAAQAEQAEQVEQAGRPERTTRVERTERPERAGRAGRVEWTPTEVERVQREWEMVTLRIREELTAHHFKKSRVWVGGASFGLIQRKSAVFARSITALDGLPGDRYVVLDGVSECFIPMSAHEARGEELIRKGANEREIRDTIESRRLRQTLLKETLTKRTGVVRDLFTWRGIERLVKSGRPALDDGFSRRGARALNDGEIVRTLSNMIAFLTQFHSTYELGVEENPEHHWPFFWMVKANEALLIEQWRDAQLNMLPKAQNEETAARETAQAPYVQLELEIRDSRIVQLFQDYFMQCLWRRLPPQSRNRTLLIHRLKEQRALVRQRMRSS